MEHSVGAGVVLWVTHEVVDVLPLALEARRAVGHDAFALRGPYWKGREGASASQ